MNAIAKIADYKWIEDFSLLPAPVVKPDTAPLPSISVIGLGYVGAVSTACLAGLGHKVIGCDVDAIKAQQIAEGVSPIHEAGLGDLLASGVEQELITATTDVADAVAATDITFVSVGTPTSEDGGCDYRYIVSAARAIGEGLARGGVAALAFDDGAAVDAQRGRALVPVGCGGSHGVSPRR